MIDPHIVFLKRTNRLFEELGDHAIGALATCHHNKPYVRSMSCIIINKQIYFQTDRNMKKAIHISENPSVSICFDNIQINGNCIEVGHPLDLRNKEFLELFERYYPQASYRYSRMKKERVYCISPKKIDTWIYLEHKPYQEEYDFEKKLYKINAYSLESVNED